MKFYHISVQRFRSLPFMRKFKAIDHFWSEDAGRLTIVTARGHSISYPGMDGRRVHVYPNYREFKQSIAPQLTESPEYYDDLADLADEARI